MSSYVNLRGPEGGEVETAVESDDVGTHDKVDCTRRRSRLPGQLVKRCEVVLAIPKRPGQDHPPCSTPCARRIRDRGSVVGGSEVVVDQGRSGLVRSGRDEFDGLGGDVLVRGEKVSGFGIDDGYAAHGYEREIEIEIKTLKSSRETMSISTCLATELIERLKDSRS